MEHKKRMSAKLFATLLLVTTVTFGKIYSLLLLCNLSFHMQTVTSQNNGSNANLSICPQNCPEGEMVMMDEMGCLVQPVLRDLQEREGTPEDPRAQED